MNLTAKEPPELIPKDLIRVETVLTRYPIHRLAKRGNVEIEIKKKSADGESTFQWEVDYSKKRGQPGPLAYKVDTLIINQRIDEAERPLPKVIKLGSLNELCKKLGKVNTRDTAKVKTALLQNAAAFITSKLTFRGNDGGEHTEEFSNTRYGIAFVGDKLPDGRTADAVYVVLNDWYWKILNNAQTRPLDYDYLKELSPGAQRLYELLSFQIYGAIESERKRAKLLYSEFCTFAPQTRYFDFEQVKKQMYKLNVPHKKSGYILHVHFQEIIGSTGELDWEMYYTPGLKAKGEHTAAKRKPRLKRPVQQALPLPPAEEKRATHVPAETTPAQIVCEAEPQEIDPLVTELIGFHVAEPTARELVRDYRRSVELQLRALPYRNLNKIRDLASWLIVAVKENHQLPEAVAEALTKEEEVRKAQAKREAADARRRDEEARRAAYFDFLRARVGQIEKTQPEAHRAFLDDEAGKRAGLEQSPAHKGAAKKIHLRLFDDELSRLERFRDYFREPTLEEWAPGDGEPGPKKSY